MTKPKAKKVAKRSAKKVNKSFFSTHFSVMNRGKTK